MYKYRITKYNPIYRNNEGWYLKDEWVDVGCIGESFEGIKLTCKQYKQVEDSYIKSIKLVMRYMKIDYIFVKDIIRDSEKIFSKSTNESPLHYNYKLIELQKTRNGSKLNIEKTVNFCRLCLRSNIGAKIFYPRRLKIYFGWDYYMYICSSISLEQIIPQIEALGLFVEPNICPYFE